MCRGHELGDQLDNCPSHGAKMGLFVKDDIGDLEAKTGETEGQNDPTFVDDLCRRQRSSKTKQGQQTHVSPECSRVDRMAILLVLGVEVGEECGTEDAFSQMSSTKRIVG